MTSTHKQPENHGRPVDTLTLAMGCFWSPEALFGQYAGVIQTRTGYAGGTTSHPVYKDLGDHSESIEIVFDPQLISLEQLLQLFWQNHRPDAINGYKDRQYASILFYRNDEQRDIMLQVQEQFFATASGTELMPYKIFYEAEERHQKYYLQRYPEIITPLQVLMGSSEVLFQSTAGTRFNAYVKGYIPLENIEKELQRPVVVWNMSVERQQMILDWVQQIKMIK